MKRGISPLMSTILLLGFAVLLGALVMSWGFSAAKTACEDVAIGIVELGGVPQSCREGSQLLLQLENNGHERISKVRIVQLTQSDSDEQDAEVDLAPGGYATITAGSQPETIKIRIIPYSQGALCVKSRTESERLACP